MFRYFIPPKLNFCLPQSRMIILQTIITSFCYAKAKHKKKFIMREREKADQAGSLMMMAMMVLVELMILKMMIRNFWGGTSLTRKSWPDPGSFSPPCVVPIEGVWRWANRWSHKLQAGHPQQEEANFFPISKDNLKIEVTNDLIYSVLVVLDSLKKYLFS